MFVCVRKQSTTTSYIIQYNNYDVRTDTKKSVLKRNISAEKDLEGAPRRQNWLDVVVEDLDEMHEHKNRVEYSREIVKAAKPLGKC